MIETTYATPTEMVNSEGRIPRLTIGMPVYNGAKYIREALDSLLAQSFGDFELIISDNDSNDGTDDICQEYAQKDPRVRYIRQLSNLGALANFEYVLHQARSEFFMWAAADDKWDQNWIESLYARIKDQPGNAAFGRLVHVDAHLSRLVHPANDALLTFVGRRMTRKLAFFLAYEGLGKANLFYALYPRRQLQNIDLRTHKFDYQILFALIDHVAFVQAGQARLFKRIHGESDGVAASSIWRPPVVLAPLRMLASDLKITSHYFKAAPAGLWPALAVLFPFKLLGALKFRLTQGFARAFSSMGGR